MSQESQGSHTGEGVSPTAGPGTVWRVTLAWPETDDVGRQERVDGLQQLLSTRAVVGLMGPGRPTEGGMVVDLVLPVQETCILSASRGGELVPGPVGDDFAWDLHRFTGAVVVNGDLATGDFAVLASDGSQNDDALARLLDEPVTSALFVGTVSTAEAEEVADRLDIGGWISDGERPVLAAVRPSTDPTALVVPGQSDLSLALRERPGRLDVVLWGPTTADATAAPTRRRRAAHRTPIVSTHLGARRRAVVLPDFMRPAGSAAAELLERLEEDFAPLSESEVDALGRVLPAAKVRDMVSAVNDAAPLGFDPEAGVLAPVEDGLMPGEESAASEPAPHARAEAVLRALGEDPSWVGLIEGVAPTGRSARPLGGELRQLATAAQPVVPPATEVPAEPEPAEQAPERTSAVDTATQALPPVVEKQSSSPWASAPNTERFDAVLAPPSALPLPSEAGDKQAAERLLAEQGKGAGGFASRVQQAGVGNDLGTFDDVISEAITGANPTVEPTADGVTPLPTPAVGTPASSAGDDSAALRRPVWALPLLIVGVLLVLLGAAAFFLGERIGLTHDLGVTAGLSSAGIGVVLAVFGALGMRR